MTRGDRAYYRRRAAAERQLSLATIHTGAARAHQQLAIEYEDRLRSGYSGLISIDDEAATVA